MFRFVNPPRRRSAYTLLEMVIVIVMSVFLLGLIFPAVQKAREVAANLSCENNLKDIGVAMQQHHATNGSFPPAGTTTPLPQGHSFLTFLLPNLGQEGLYRSIDLEQSVWSRANLDSSAKTTIIKMFICPTAIPRTGGISYVAAGYLPADSGATNLGPVDYAVVTGVGGSFASLLPAGSEIGNTGLLQLDSRATKEDCQDGLSNTIVMAEDAGRTTRFDLGKQIPGRFSSGGAWLDYHAEFTVDGYASNGACAVNCTNDNEIYSFHPGGAQILRADGSVTFLRRSISPGVLAAAISKAGGEAVVASDF
ncbi:DUF1559 family PulG-like putative transporter [Tuwongella immobilis]|uniref:DUF1559 domain-containing protein n=1 Tax=Tuwongella immobilis TaxID=692036 RepID=A0A6C2YPP2_9BACT|nr:DUF1559 domain-containing protein [Tuwongella immobilis]VIP03590.1 Uncharacterized protein OS=Pirellula staleyi (strain ATCC 27377 / DSM 6068 / ICPB 4128) GN=Psta_0324 PE=4 SV=1: SBP_bac_10 [Tuwongella immobilis]VTS04548.1 Uncharacterized protein OS=Pirellula staleyi (strain ATCC 27377 / DSM 6068 / ICPB 4128) GN=Psta_0324 PE=4 SV=1: SBP_bac_10 [Tuwongella immobilis]